MINGMILCPAVLAFHPEFAQNARFYVHVTVDNGGPLIGWIRT